MRTPQLGDEFPLGGSRIRAREPFGSRHAQSDARIDAFSDPGRGSGKFLRAGAHTRLRALGHALAAGRQPSRCGYLTLTIGRVGRRASPRCITPGPAQFPEKRYGVHWAPSWTAPARPGSVALTPPMQHRPCSIRRSRLLLPASSLLAIKALGLKRGVSNKRLRRPADPMRTRRVRFRPAGGRRVRQLRVAPAMDAAAIDRAGGTPSAEGSLINALRLLP
jgi:hypothetical protein